MAPNTKQFVNIRNKKNFFGFSRPKNRAGFFVGFHLRFFREENLKNPEIWDMGFGIPEKSHPKVTSG